MVVDEKPQPIHQYSIYEPVQEEHHVNITTYNHLHIHHCPHYHPHEANQSDPNTEQQSDPYHKLESETEHEDDYDYMQECIESIDEWNVLTKNITETPKNANYMYPIHLHSLYRVQKS